MRCIVDSNVLVSAVVLSSSAPRQAVERVLHHDILLFSEATANELKDVLSRTKFDRYVSRKERVLFLAQLASVAEFVPIVQLVRACRDPEDDKFLEVALNGRADLIITGDADLLAMHPWREIKIVSPAEFLKSGSR